MWPARFTYQDARPVGEHGLHALCMDIQQANQRRGLLEEIVKQDKQAFHEKMLTLSLVPYL